MRKSLSAGRGICRWRARAQGDPQPTCKMCPGTYIPSPRLEAYSEEGDRREADRSAGPRVEIGKAQSASAWCTAASWTSRRRTRWPSTTS